MLHEIFNHFMHKAIRITIMLPQSHSSGTNSLCLIPHTPWESISSSSSLFQPSQVHHDESNVNMNGNGNVCMFHTLAIITPSQTQSLPSSSKNASQLLSSPSSLLAPLASSLSLSSSLLPKSSNVSKFSSMSTRSPLSFSHSSFLTSHGQVHRQYPLIVYSVDCRTVPQRGTSRYVHTFLARLMIFKLVLSRM